MLIDNKSKLNNKSRNNNNNNNNSNDREIDAWLHNFCVYQMKCNRDTIRLWLNFSSISSQIETIHRQEESPRDSEKQCVTHITVGHPSVEV